MTIADDPERKATFARKPKPIAEDPIPELRRPEGISVQFGPTKSAPGSRLKGGR